MSQPINKKRASLSALTAAAMALPGIAKAEIQTDYFYAHYQEGDISADRSASGKSAERYKVDTHLFRLAAPVGEHVAQLDLTYESMSGASPWWVQPDANGKPVQVMSGASIRDQRVAGQVSYGLPLGGIDWGFRAGYSTERDYRALHGGVEAQFTPDNKDYTVSGGLGYSADRVEPTDAGDPRYPTRISSASRNGFNAYAGVSWVLGPRTTVQTSLSYGRDSGFLSDPYKQAFIVAAAGTVADSRPDGRQSVALSAKLRHYVSSIGGAAHLDYRLYHDDWSVTAHTLELGWDQTLAETWRVSPSLRWYSQSQAFFYAPYFNDYRSDGFASSDYRLSPYGAISGRVDVRKLWGDWELGGGVEYYEASGHYALKKVDVENPGLLQYLTVNLRLAYRF